MQRSSRSHFTALAFGSACAFAFRRLSSARRASNTRTARSGSAPVTCCPSGRPSVRSRPPFPPGPTISTLRLHSQIASSTSLGRAAPHLPNTEPASSSGNAPNGGGGGRAPSAARARSLGLPNPQTGTRRLAENPGAHRRQLSRTRRGEPEADPTD